MPPWASSPPPWPTYSVAGPKTPSSDPAPADERLLGPYLSDKHRLLSDHLPLDGSRPAPAITAAMCALGRGVSEPRLSPSGTHVAFVSSAAGHTSIAVMPVDGAGPEVTLTAEPRPVGVHAYGGGAFDWVGDDAIVYVTRDGDLVVLPVTGGPPRLLAHGAAAPAASPDGQRVAYLADDNRHVFVASVAEGGPSPWRVSTGSTDFALDPSWAPDSRRLTWLEWDVPAMAWDAGRVMVADVDSQAPPTRVAGGGGEAGAAQQPRFSPDGSRLGFLCDASGWLNLWLASADGQDASPAVDEPFEHGGPPWGPGQRSWCWSPDGSAVAFVRNEGGFGRLATFDVASGRHTERAKGVHTGLSWAGRHLAAVRTGGVTPTALVAYETDSWRRSPLVRGPVAGFEPSLVEPESVSWAGEDGGEVHGRLWRPRQPLTEPPPLLVWVHGGPTGQTPVAFNARYAFWIERGWAVLDVDHRGSVGWGRSYRDAMIGRWGELDVADIAAGMRAAADEGWGDRSRMVPIGGSAGGFAVLCLLAHHPELCAAGVDLYGVADLLDLDETTHRFEAHYLHTVVGPRPEHTSRYLERSPVHLADRIRGPLLILQGEDDKAVPPAQSQAIAEAARRAGAVVEHHTYAGEGHGWSKPATVMDELERTEDFLRRHVLGTPRWR